MVAAAIAAARLGPTWSSWAILLVAAIAGNKAGGYTGVAYAEYAHLGGAAVTVLGGYAIVCTTLAPLALGSALLLCLETWTPRTDLV